MSAMNPKSNPKPELPSDSGRQGSHHPGSRELDRPGKEEPSMNPRPDREIHKPEMERPSGGETGTHRGDVEPRKPKPDSDTQYTPRRHDDPVPEIDPQEPYAEADEGD